MEQEADPASAARTILLDKLAGQPRTRAELADVLAEREIPDDVADEVLDRFTEVGLIDDAAFANAWVESRHRGRGLGKRALAQELRRRGVDEELARDALEELEPEQEEETARQLVRRKLRSMRSLERQVAMRRLLGMLARKGYPGGMAMSIVKEELDASHDEFPLLDSSGLGPEWRFGPPKMRDATAADRAGIQRLLRELHGDGADSTTLPEIRQQARTFVSGDDGDVHGLVVVTFVNYGHEPYGVVEEPVVDPANRGSGTGTALLAQCRSWLGGLGAEVVGVSAINEEAAEFYLQAGFTRRTGPWLWAAADQPA
jgi:regulatory protein